MIDVHIHVAPPQLPGAGALSPSLRLSAPQVAARVREQMREAGVTLAFAMGEWRIRPDDPLGISRTQAIAALVPELRVIGVMDPTKDPADFEHFQRVEQQLASGAVVAIKGYLGYLHAEPGHPTYRRYYELAGQYRRPVIFHTGDTYSPYAKLKYAHPLGVDDVAVDHPETRFVLAHLGNPWTLDAAEVIYKNMNVWADLSGLLVGDATTLDDESTADTIADVRHRVLVAYRYADRPNRFLYGSDWPLIPMAVYAEFIRTMIPARDHELLFHENAELLFRP